MEQQIVYSIYNKLGEVMKEVTAIDKTRKNEQQGFMFRGIEDFMNELHNSFAKHGIIILPHELEHIQESYEVEKANSRGQIEKKLQFRTRVHMEFKFISTDDGSFVEADGWGEAADNGDKGYNKCKSIALKYVLMQMFLVPTKDIADPDKETPDEVSAPRTRMIYKKSKEVSAPATAAPGFFDNGTADVSAEGSDDLYLVKQLIKEAKTKDELLKIWNDWPEAHDKIKGDFSARRKELGIQ